MTDYNTLITLLQKLGDIGNPICPGCGYEHNCISKGCAILRDAVATMDQLYKGCEQNCETCTYVDVPSDAEPCSTYFCGPDLKCSNWQWKGVQEEEKDNG